jgi:hypothetical protein
MSNQARASTSEEVDPPVVNEILAHVGKAADDLEALVAKGVSGDTTADEVLEQGVVVLTRATMRLLAARGRYEDRLRKLEDEERDRKAAADLLVCIQSVYPICVFTDLMQGKVESADPLAHLPAIAQHLRQMQERLAESVKLQEHILSRVYHLEDLQEAVGTRFPEELQKIRDDLHIRNHSPESSESPESTQSLEHQGKTQKKQRDSNMSQTSGAHSRKSSLQHSGKSGKRALDKAVDFFRNVTKSLHRRRPSEGITPGRELSSSFRQGSRLASIAEEASVAPDSADQ